LWEVQLVLLLDSESLGCLLSDFAWVQQWERQWAQKSERVMEPQLESELAMSETVKKETLWMGPEWELE